MLPMWRTSGVVLLGEAQHHDASIVHVEVELHGRGRRIPRMLSERLAEVIGGCLSAPGSEVPV